MILTELSLVSERHGGPRLCTRSKSRAIGVICLKMSVLAVWIPVCVSVTYLRFWIIIDVTASCLKLGDIAVNLTEIPVSVFG